MAKSFVLANLLNIAGAAQLKRLSPEKAPFNPGALRLEDFENAAQNSPVKFFLYDMEKFEPRFDSEQFSNCSQKGADYMFIKSLRNSENRVSNSSEAEVMVVPCLFETFRRCAIHDHQQNNIPWKKAFDDDTQSCLDKVMDSRTFRESNGTNHVWVVADPTISHGFAAESELFKQMTIGRNEIVDPKTAEISHRQKAVEQSRCSFVVPYASDVAYKEQWNRVPSYAEWRERSHTIHFRFQKRQYVLSCGEQPCEGAVDAAPLRNKSFELAERFGDALVESRFVEEKQYSDELHDAKFCLVMRGDTPSSHAYYDALSASCVPILVSDDWDAVSGPFATGTTGFLHGGLKHHEYTLRFPEETFMEDLPAVVNKINRLLADNEKMQELYEGMQAHRSALLWSMPNNTVSEFALQSARRCVRSA